MATITITGATGDVGGRTLRLLGEAGADVRAVARRPEQVARFERQGTEAVLAGLDDVDALTAAFAGTEQLLLITAPGPRQAVHGRNAVQAARNAGVRAITHLSTADGGPDSPVPWARANWHTDQLVKISGLDWTILRPSAFMSNLLQFARPVARGWYPQTTGRGAIAWTDTEDIARVAATVLQAGAHAGNHPFITGPELLTSQQVAATFSAVLGRRVRHLPVPSRAFAGAARLGGADAWTAEGLRQQFARVVRHSRDNVDVRTDDVQRITGRPATTLASWIHAHRDRFTRR
ncbi:NAD(P)H-binding protein [Actinoplanes sp. M2I2]|uniref:NAD(P)H-binding protein n=1 Tax=Actinoplanes sp. M2I2 TaxID=1734444 RepID=UPI00202207BD|nr:NAD(P)H-binding protein [Actinoplanes sp. M2I2]